MGWLKNLMGSFSTKVQNSQNAAAAPKNDEPAPSDVVGTYEYGMRLLEKENVEKALIFPAARLKEAILTRSTTLRSSTMTAPA